VTDRLPWAQHLTLGIYDAVDYALNAANVPVVTYGGERDPQLLASTTMQKLTGELQVPLQVLIGAGMGHEFDADSRRKFMDFHLERSLVGRPQYGQRKKLRFSTRSFVTVAATGCVLRSSLSVISRRPQRVKLTSWILCD